MHVAAHVAKERPSHWRYQCVLMVALYSCGGDTCTVNDLLDGLERTSDKLPAIGTGRAIINAVNATAH